MSMSIIVPLDGSPFAERGLHIASKLARRSGGSITLFTGRDAGVPADIDEYLQDEGRFTLRWITIDEDKTHILSGIARILESVGAESRTSDPLEAARGLVAMVLELPAWAQRTQSISDEARAVRDTLLKASDPHKVLFVDLAAILGSAPNVDYVEALRSPIEGQTGIIHQPVCGELWRMSTAQDRGDNVGCEEGEPDETRNV